MNFCCFSSYNNGILVIMTDDSFLIHLISNVAPDVFPKNNPSKFSTPLAEEIDVSGDGWEVGVRQIMYPIHVATTGEEDKIHIYDYKRDSYKSSLPFPPVKGINASPATTITMRVSDKNKSILFEEILIRFNNSPWAKDDIFTLLYRKDKKKFILNSYDDDIVIQMNKSMKNYLGFEEEADVCFNRGTTWADYIFNENAKPSGNFTLKMYDVKSLESEKLELYPTSDLIFLSTIDNEHKQWSYTASINYRYQDTMPNELKRMVDNEDKREVFITIDNVDNTLRILPASPHSRNIMKYVKKTAFIRIHYLEADKEKYTDIYNVQFTKGRKQIIKLPFLKSKDEMPGRKKFTLTVYYDNFRKLKPDEMLPNPIASFNVTHEKEIQRPWELLPSLNIKSSKYGYEFNYNRDTNRFELDISKYGLQLSKSLYDILGFNEFDDKAVFCKTRIAATSFPVLHRGITALYVYTNITDPVYVGDVKAPLLLTCPFKKSDVKRNVTEQQEFLNPCYAPLNRSKLQQVDIGIYDDAGTLIPFLYGKTKLSLHFRRRKAL